MTATHEQHLSTTAAWLHLAFELGWSQWGLAFTIGHGQPAPGAPSEHAICPRC